MAAAQSMLEQRLEELTSDASEALLTAGRVAEAEKQFRELVQLQQRVLGQEHEDTLNSQIHHAYALSGLGRHVEAESILREVVQVQQQSPSYGMEHPCTLACVGVLGLFLMNLGRYKEAEPMLRQVHALQLRLLGPRHAELLGIQATLGNCLVADGQLQEAEGLLRDALEAYQDMVASDPVPGIIDAKASGVGSSMHDLAACLLKAGKHVEAESLLRAAVRYTRHNLGEQSMFTLGCMNQHASALAALGKHAEAEVMHRLAVQGSRSAFGWAHLDTQTSTFAYVNCLLVQKKLAPAEALLRETLSHLKQALGKDNPTVLNWMRKLATFLQYQAQANKRSEGDALLRKVRKLERSTQK